MVYFIRVPKTGSQALGHHILTYLQIHNNFKAFSRTPPAIERAFLPYDGQEIIVNESISQGENTVFIGMHENFIEYGSFNLTRPIFVSLVRHPIERQISWYYYIRSDLYTAKNRTLFAQQMIRDGGEKNWRAKTFEQCVLRNDMECEFLPMNPKRSQSYKRQIIHFCGNHESCWQFGSPLAVQMAKENIERNFAVVGTWEEPEITLTVLEKYVPKYFKDALKLYKKHEKEITINKNNKKPVVSDKIKKILYKNFTGELDFYYFCKQRLYKQYLAVTEIKSFEL